MTGPIAKLGGATCLGSSAVVWASRDGVNPVTAEVDLAPDEAKGLLEGRATPQTLTLGDGSVSAAFFPVYVVGPRPSSNPNLRRVLIADRRWWWPYRLVFRAGYNVRRRVGYERIKTPDAQEIQPVAEDIWYAPWSTKDGDGKRPWTATEILRDVLEFVMEKEPGGKKTIKFEGGFGGKLDELPVENLTLADTGERAIAKVLQALPQIGIRVDPDGTVVVYSRVTGLETGQVAAAGAESVGRGHVEMISHHRERPSMVRVFFTREVEVRFDFKEDESRTVQTDERYTDNVLPVPDYELSLDGGEPVAQGTWISFPEAFDAWGGLPFHGGGTQALNFAWLRRAMVPFVDFWTTTGLQGSKDPDADWVARLSAMQQHYRQTYRINRRWMDRLHSIRGERVTIVHPETGTRSPAMAYSDYCRLGGQRAIMVSGKKAAYAMNVARGFTNAQAIPDDAQVAPARVRVADSDQGILHLDFLNDVVRMWEMTLPGLMEINGTSDPGPTPDIRNADLKPIAFDMMPTDAQGSIPQLASTYLMSVILTCLAGSPNDARQLHAIDVSPQDVSNMLPAAMAKGLGSANGPVMEIHIAPTPETTARVEWRDDKKSEIERLFGIGGGQKDEPVDLTAITVNAGRPDAPLDAIAHAAAASVYASYADRMEGSKTVRMAPSARLSGWLAEVVWEVTTSGEVQTRLILRGERPSVDLHSLMPPSVRALVTRQAQPGGAG